jgi:uncharacterized protein DUF1302
MARRAARRRATRDAPSLQDQPQRQGDIEIMQQRTGTRLNTALWRRRSTALAIGAMLAGGAHAFEIETGNPDISMRWDNTFRYNLGVRAQSQDPNLLASPNFDDGDRNFSNGSIVTNRLDLLSEFDFIYQRKHGFRVSAAGWYDDAYRHLDNTNSVTANTLVDGLPVAGRLSPYTERYAKGLSGEILDAFAFTNFDVGNVPVNVKAGQHTVYWGESLLLGGAIHGISYSQNSIDVWKGFATPGSEAKELFRPRGGLTLQVQPLHDLTLAGQWFYNWQAIRLPESGSYLTVNDAGFFGGESLIFSPNPLAASVPGAPAYFRFWNTNQIQQSRTSGSLGDFGLSARWSPAWLDGTLGFYYRNATDITPQLVLTPGFSAAVPAGACSAIGGLPLGGTNCIINRNATSPTELQRFGKVGTYQLAYGNDIHIYGVSLSKQILGVSVGAELSYRENMPLVSQPVQVLPAGLLAAFPGSVATTTDLGHGTPGALGDTWHGLINATNVFPKTPLFDTATLAAELTWNQWARVTQNEAVFKGRSGYRNADGSDPIDKVTRNFVGLAINFTPTWFQVWPGVDLSAPLSWSQGLSGNSAVVLGGNENAGTWSAGIAFDIYQKYRIDLKYNGYLGDYALQTIQARDILPNGSVAAISDRGWVSLTFKTTF